MRIAIVGNSHWPAAGGSQVYQRLLSQELSKHHDVVVLAQHRQNGRQRVLDRTFGQRVFEPYYDGEVKVRCVGPGLLERIRLLPFAYFYLPVGVERKRQAKPAFMRYFAEVYGRKLERILSEFDLVHTFNIEYLGSACIEIANGMGLPCVATPQIHPGWWLDDAFTMQMLRRCDFVFSALEHDRRYMIDHGMPAEKIEAVGAPFNADVEGNAQEFRNRFELGSHPLICFIGVKRSYKGYDELIEAAPLVWKEFPETRFVFIGSRTEHSKRVFAEAADPRILELGYVDSRTKNNALAACNVFCLPSASESFGIVFLEAWHFGKPVIAADVPSSRELVGGCDGGLTVPQRANAISEAIITLLRYPKKREQMAANGHKVAHRYTIEEIGQRVQDVYQTLIDRDK